MPSIVPNGFGLSALPEYNPLNPSAFVVQPGALAQGAVGALSAVPQGVANVFKTQQDIQRNQIGQIAAQEAVKNYQDREELDNEIKSNAKDWIDNGEEAGPFAKILGKIQNSAGFLPATGEQLWKGLQIAMEQEKTQQQGQLINAQIPQIAAEANYHNAQAALTNASAENKPAYVQALTDAAQAKAAQEQANAKRLEALAAVAGQGKGLVRVKGPDGNYTWGRPVNGVDAQGNPTLDIITDSSGAQAYTPPNPWEEVHKTINDAINGGAVPISGAINPLGITGSTNVTPSTKPTTSGLSPWVQNALK
jgi:hypothetical protein